MILILLLICFAFRVEAQRVIRVINVTTGKTSLIKKGYFIQCRYKVLANHERLIGGIVRQITDSSLVYSSTLLTPRKEIRLSTVTHIDRVPFRRAILPALAMGTIVGKTDKLVNPKASADISSLRIAAGTVLTLEYVYKVNRRHLNRNVVGPKTALEVVKEDLD